MEALGKLFGSLARVKVMKLFLFNDEAVFERKEVAKRSKISSAVALHELNLLTKAGILKKKKPQGYILNKNFPFLDPIQNLLMHSAPMQSKEISKRLSGIGKIKAIIVSGIFIQNPESRLDILVVGDDVSPGRLKTVIGNMESEIGKELRFALLDTADFKYRQGVCDRLVRDVFEYPHKVVVDKVGIEYAR
ncbi:MAG: hypothetical protein KBD10_00185 [Candidatus Pacebacteria bacterium]|nr:hypothetical protein [Candidatus Paceibacterota bacterium]